MMELKEQEHNQKFDLKLWWEIFKYTLPMKKLILLLIVSMVLVAVVEAAFPLMTLVAIDRFIYEGQLEGISGFIALYGLLVILLAGNIWLFISIAGKIETTLTYDIRKKGFKRLQELSLSYYDNKAVGWLMARMTSDITRLGEIVSWGMVDILWGFTKMTAIIAVMLFLNWQLALISLSVIPILLITSLYFQKKILKEYRSVRKINSKITGSFNEGITGAKTTKVLVREAENLEEFTGITREMQASSIRAAIFSSMFLPIVLTFGSIGTALALWFGGIEVAKYAITYGTLVAFISYTIQFFEPIRELARVFAEIQSAHASAERVMSMINTEPEIKDSLEIVSQYGDSFDPLRKNWPEIKGNITFRNVSFSYISEEPILKDFNLEVKAGETIALVGETGSGKSTIVNLACRFYEPTKGEILIDGVNYRERSQLWLQSNLGYVLQSPHLFSGTIKENIQYGRLDANEMDIIRAAKLVNAHDFIMKLEKGYDSEVGEGGGLLSSGEKQLISFARAVLANPKIFVLDEATSSIDTETEQMIQKAISRILKGRTSFIIAHRLSTIRSADRILVIRKGRIEEAGNHLQLIQKKGYYYRLYTNQFMEEEGKKALEK
ncbi:ABC transporter ATP-binding protein [Alkaliphilus peptidifermentans]|uniref:ATP-binding cassette, subfamily B n=1 Tax=Alkaliphilus peptidifermentans DSM 18978 TaxID=1120976 RepID=A0A1G5BEJ1_9FIRM|nr:ABC transporter ATP-binding protein [Alkaliphilus peptidifermentans]SCX88539.1 ATP-binding cassette, subfamily B [Alkaliphilus peptidifermentans DSM 18978]